jgi:hypothetical protein
MTFKQFVLTALLTVFSLTTFASEYYKATTTLNVRSGAGTGYSVLFTIQTGDEVELIGKKNNWYEIKSNEKIGYASSEYLEFSRSIDDKSKSEFKEDHDTKNQYFVIGISGALILLIIVIYLSGSNKKKNTSNLNESIKTERGVVSNNILSIQKELEAMQKDRPMIASTIQKKEPSMTVYGITCALIGLIIGYLIYGRIPFIGEYLSPEVLFGLRKSDDVFESMIHNAIVEPIKQKVFTSAVFGGVTGIIIALLRKRKK